MIDFESIIIIKISKESADLACACKANVYPIFRPLRAAVHKTKSHLVVDTELVTRVLVPVVHSEFSITEVSVPLPPGIIDNRSRLPGILDNRSHPSGLSRN